VTRPLPPANIATRTPRLVRIKAGATLHRFFTQAFEPVHFDRSPDGRLNAPDGSYGVLYAAETVNGAFAETFLRQPGRQQIPSDLLARKAQVRLRVTRELVLVRLSGPGLAAVGATAEITHGGLPYGAPQAWSAALHAHPIVADGIAYTARHDDSELCYAIYDRAHDAVVEVDRETSLDSHGFWTLAEHYGVGRAPD
jgi:hypothetical protein